MRKIVFKWMGVLLGTLIVVFLAGCGKDTAYYVDAEGESVSTQEEENLTEDIEDSQEEKIIYVYVCGQVNSPGVYMLIEGSRVMDLFVAADGLTSDAATEYWNQARLLVDGEMIYVPTKEEAEDFLPETMDNGGNKSKKVNINTASKEELMTLPGIGESKALAIIAYRQKNGPFTSIEDIKKIEGIKDGVYAKVREYIEI